MKQDEHAEESESWNNAYLVSNAVLDKPLRQFSLLRNKIEITTVVDALHLLGHGGCEGWMSMAQTTGRNACGTIKICLTYSYIRVKYVIDLC